MNPQVCTHYDNLDDPLVDAEGLEETSEDDLCRVWFPISIEAIS
jgi:hypothetical protein